MKSNLFLEKSFQVPFLIMSHRGFWGGNVIENTIEAAFLAFQAGADIAEVDVCRSADKVYYLFHDGNEQRLLSKAEPFQALSSQEISGSAVYNSIGNPSGRKLNTLSQFLDWLPENCLVNLDRSWEYWSEREFFDLLINSGKKDQLVLKSPVKKEYLDAFAENGKDFLYMPIVRTKEEVELVLSYPEIQTIGLELVPLEDDSDLLDQTFLESFRGKGFLLAANAEKLGCEFNLFAGADDDTALLQGERWEKFISSGMTVIQTDWPNFLLAERGHCIQKEHELVPEEIKNYEGKADPISLVPKMGTSFKEIKELKNVVSLLERWQYRSALKKLNSLIEQEIQLINSLLLKGELLALFDYNRQAIEVLERVLQTEPENLPALSLIIFQLAAAKGDPNEIESYLSVLENASPELAGKVKNTLQLIKDSYDNIEVPEPGEKVDLICVFGYFLNDDGSMPEKLEERLIQTWELAQKYPQSIILLSGGAVQNEYVEAAEMKKYLAERGIEESRLVSLETASDTVGNVMEFLEYIQKGEYQHICAVTSFAHLPRAWMSLYMGLKRQKETAYLYGTAKKENIDPGVLETEIRLCYQTVTRTAGLFKKKDIEEESMK